MCKRKIKELRIYFKSCKICSNFFRTKHQKAKICFECKQKSLIARTEKPKNQKKSLKLPTMIYNNRELILNNRLLTNF